MQSDQFFTNEAIIAALGYPTALHKQDRTVFHSTKEETQQILESAKRIEQMANEWLKENK